MCPGRPYGERLPVTNEEDAMYSHLNAAVAAERTLDDLRRAARHRRRAAAAAPTQRDDADGVVGLAESMDFQVLTGACLSVESGVPFAPVVEALRPVLTSRPERLGPSGGPLTGLLKGAGTGLPPGQLLELLLGALGHLADAAPVLLVLEDIHWADASTRDLAVHLALHLRGPVCLLMSYRSDDLHRRHPLRPSLTEL